MRLKLTNRKVEFQTFSGGYTPGPPLQGEGRAGEGRTGQEGREKGGELDPHF